MSQLELLARPLRRDASRLVVPLLILPGLVFALVHAPAATVLCPLMLGPWLWWRRERFWLDRCRVLVDGATLQICYGQRQLATLDLRYATRQFTRAGDLVLSEGDASYLALGVDPPEHAYPDPGSLTSRGAAPPDETLAAAGNFPLPTDEPDASDESESPLGTWRAFRLQRADLVRLCSHLAAVPTRPAPEASDEWSLLQALGSAGVTGQRVEEHLTRLVHAEGTQARPSGLVTTLRERALEPGPAGAAARRILGGT